MSYHFDGLIGYLQQLIQFFKFNTQWWHKYHYIPQRSYYHTSPASFPIPKAERFAARPTLASLFKDTGGDKEKRNVKIHEAIRRYGYTLNQVEAVVGLHYSTISRIMKKVEHNSQMSKTKLC
ncbi:MAG: hypothetical protein LR006_00300 [Dehalococcoidia bacterium]|nr:hypothetical protein [Dehalococcoidia bacterium]MCL0029636.1 hypothetical protein [Dehalococcoidia bacterium]MCL0072713.1 hypothetical protein [Dehalococcoidia bacterium]MCL0072731.1 hypothetical protein [Dehalococcoidia bacterium]